MANCSSTKITEVSSNQKKLLENIHRIVTKTVLSLFVVNLRQSDWFLKISKTASMHSSHQNSCRLQNKKKQTKFIARVQTQKMTLFEPQSEEFVLGIPKSYHFYYKTCPKAEWPTGCCHCPIIIYIHMDFQQRSKSQLQNWYWYCLVIGILQIFGNSH